MEECKRGSIIELFEHSKQKYLIINNIDINGIIYLLTMPIDNLEKIEIDYSKMILLKYNKTTKEVGFESNEDIIKQVVEKTAELSNG